MSNTPRYKRILLKLSGEALAGSGGYGIDAATLARFAAEVRTVHEMGVEIGLVVGGGNIYRGSEGDKAGIDKVSGDYMGMLATMINGLALQNALEHEGMFTRLMSAIAMDKIAEPFIRRRAVRHLEKGRVVIFGAGTGNPYFTTDTAAVLRAIEIHADVIIKGTRVDGIYDSDPEKNKSAKRFEKISYREVIEKRLGVMDMTAITLCQENSLPLYVFNMNVDGNLRKLILGDHVGSLVTT